MRLRWRCQALTAILAFGLGIVRGADARERPNILFVMADDHGAWASAASGHPDARTPVMERLAREGARFVNAFTPTPVCSPARASLLTSRYGSELGIVDYLRQPQDADLGLPTDAVAWPVLLRNAGYVTGLAGKWHLGVAERFHPQRFGYTWFSGFLTGAVAPLNPTLETEGRLVRREGYTVDLVTEDALAFIERNRDRAFALSVHYREPHAPYLPVAERIWEGFRGIDPQIPNPDLPGLDTAEVKRRTREYLASVSALDANLGRLLDRLEALGLTRRTLVIYTSDHGYNLGHHGLAFKGNARWLLAPEAMPEPTAHIPRNQRPNMFDTSIKVPLLVRWPGVVAPGRVIAETVSLLDWLPTLAALAGAQMPEGTTVRGRDVSRLLRGEPFEDVPGFYGEYSMRHGATADLRMYRTAEWKLVRDLRDPRREEFYDLLNDPDETINLVPSADPRVRAARRRLHAELDDAMSGLPQAAAIGRD